MYYEVYEQARKLVKECGNILKTKTYTHLDYKTGKQDLVSDMDTYIGNVLSVSLMKLVEGSIVVNEEAQYQMGDYMWILDPIDGTTNYVSFHENFAVSLAFYVKKQPVFGIVYDVMKEEMFHAYTGKGAFCNSQKLLPLPEVTLSESVWDCSYGSIIDFTKKHADMLSIQKESRGHRALGCASLAIAHIAQGKLQASLSSHVKCWDYAAACILLKEVNGTWQIRNDFFTMEKTEAIFCSCTSLLKEIQRYIQE